MKSAAKIISTGMRIESNFKFTLKLFLKIILSKSIVIHLVFIDYYKLPQLCFASFLSNEGECVLLCVAEVATSALFNFASTLHTLNLLDKLCNLPYCLFFSDARAFAFFL